MFKALLNKKPLSHDAHSFYGAVVAAARSPEFYTKFGVPDSFDGRFEMMILHLSLLHSWLQNKGSRGKRLSLSLIHI